MVCFECDACPGDPLDSGARWLIILLRGSELWFGATAEDAEIEWRWEERVQREFDWAGNRRICRGTFCRSSWGEL